MKFIHQIYENDSYQAIDNEVCIQVYEVRHQSVLEIELQIHKISQFLEIYPRRPIRHLEVSLLLHIISHICIDRFLGVVKNCSFLARALIYFVP